MTESTPNPYQLLPAAALDAVLDSLPDPGWIARPVWPGDAYGPMAAESKIGKTWAAMDLGISVATGGGWMEAFPCDKGRVAYFLGEGGHRNTGRRIRAICAFKGIDPQTLKDDLSFTFRVPQLTGTRAMAEVRLVLDLFRPTLVIIDPLYLAAGGANGASLYDMGQSLMQAQLAASRAGAALVVVHHYNQTGSGGGPGRMSGAGPQEWGRVLATADRTGHMPLPGGVSQVDMKWSFEGGEIMPSERHFRRRVWVENPEDLSSPMHYEIEEVEADSKDGLTHSQRAVLAVLTDTYARTSEVVSATNRHLEEQGSKTVSKRTVENALSKLYPKSIDRTGKEATGYGWRMTPTSNADRDVS